MVAGLLSIVLVSWSGVLALLVLFEALNGSRYAHWSDDPGVQWGELALAACSAVLSVVTAVLIGRRSRDGSPAGAGTMLGIGLGFLVCGGLAYLVGSLGLRVPTAGGYDALERNEIMFIIGGIVTAVVGALVALGSLVALGRGDRRD